MNDIFVGEGTRSEGRGREGEKQVGCRDDDKQGYAKIGEQRKRNEEKGGRR